MIFPSGMSRILILVWFSLTSLAAIAQDIPTLSGDKLVYDFAGILTDSEEKRLDQKLQTFEDTTSNEIVIAIVQDLLGYAVNDYAIRMAEQSGIGKANEDNGVLVLVAPNEREMSIEVGYGLEPAIPDGVAGTIIRDYITPSFKKEDYYRGLDEGTNMLMKLASGEISKDMVGSKKDKDFPWGFLIPIGIFILFSILGNRRRNRYTDIDGRGYRSTGPIWWGGGLGGGRSSGGGSFGGGGFGGFGGGSFGGGGASGSW